MWKCRLDFEATWSKVQHERTKSTRDPRHEENASQNKGLEHSQQQEDRHHRETPKPTTTQAKPVKASESSRTTNADTHHTSKGLSLRRDTSIRSIRSDEPIVPKGLLLLPTSRKRPLAQQPTLELVAHRHPYPQRYDTALPSINRERQFDTTRESQPHLVEAQHLVQPSMEPVKTRRSEDKSVADMEYVQQDHEAQRDSVQAVGSGHATQPWPLPLPPPPPSLPTAFTQIAPPSHPQFYTPPTRPHLRQIVYALLMGLCCWGWILRKVTRLFINQYTYYIVILGIFLCSVGLSSSPALPSGALSST